MIESNHQYLETPENPTDIVFEDIVFFGTPGFLEILQCLAPHGCIYVQIRNTHNSTEFLQDEEYDPVMNHPPPGAFADQITLFFRQLTFAKHPFLISQEAFPVLRIYQIMEKTVDSIGFVTALQRIGIGAFQQTAGKTPS